MMWPFRKQRKRIGKKHPRTFEASLSIERLETRIVLSTTLYLDFGLGIGMGNDLSATTLDLATIDGLGIGGFGTGPNLIGRGNPIDGFLTSTDVIDLTPLAYDFDLDGGLLDNDDITALASAVLLIIERAMEPFDIDVQLAAATSLADVVTTLNRARGKTMRFAEIVAVE